MIPSRICCSQCHRPIKTCICHLFTSINNNVHIVVLQHPTEVKQTKGTAFLLTQSLINSDLIVGEDFSENDELNQLIQKYQSRCFLLYPDEHAINVETINVTEQDQGQFCVVLLDGTWKKSYRMLMLSKNLQKLPRLTLPDTIVGQYHIRKTHKANALSTLEAAVYTLISLEKNTDKYKVLLNGFAQFNQFQLSFIPSNK
jgi:DTW domain-containing protein YfiP